MISLDFPNAVDHIERLYGRYQELDLITSTLLENNRVPVVVIGERRIGKTSIQKVAIRRLKDLYQEELIALEVEPRGILSVNEFVEAVLSRLSIWGGHDLRESGLLAETGHILMETPAQFDFAFDRLTQNQPTQRFLLCVDEFDEVIRVAEEAGEAEKLRLMGLVHHLVENTHLPIRLFLTMTRLPEGADAEVASPLLAKSQVVELRPFELEDMEKMVFGLVQGEAVLDRCEVKRLFEMSGGHPYITKLILANLFEKNMLVNERLVVTQELLEEAIQNAVDDLRGNYALENVYRVHFNADEKRVMLYLAERDEPVDIGELRAAGMGALTAAKCLEKRHYLVERFGEYSLRAQFLGEWLRNWVEFDEEIERLSVNLMVSSWKNSESAGLADDLWRR